MKRRWFAVILMAWVNILTLIALVPMGPSGMSANPLVGVAYADDAPTTPPAAEDPDATPKPSCDAGEGGLSWMICGMITTLVGPIDWIRDSIIVPFLKEKPLDKDADGAKVYAIWGSVRNLASVFFILVFFLIIFGTAIGFDNYTVKKVLPRLIAGAILVPFSWYICVAVVDLGNVLGQGLLGLTSGIIVFDAANGIDYTKPLTQVFLIGGAALLGVGGLAAITSVSLGAIITMLLGFFAVFVTLVLRKILIIMLIVLSPLALLAWILPNTEKWFKTWWSDLLRLVLMYPIIMLFFEAGRLFASVAPSIVGGEGTGNLDAAVVPIMQIMALTLPLFGVPFAFSLAGRGMKLGGGLISKASSAANGRYGKNSDGAKQRATERKGRYSAIANDPNRNGALRAFARKRSGNGGFIKGSNIGNRIAGTRAGRYTGLGMLTGMNPAAQQRLQADATAHENLEAGAIARQRARQELGRPSSADLINQKAETQFDKQLDERVSEIALKEITIDVRDKQGNITGEKRTGRMGDMDLDPSLRQHLKDTITTSANAGDHATTIAAMQSLGRSQGGRQDLRGIKRDVFGGTPEQTVNSTNLGGNAKTVWDKGTSKVNGDKAPDLHKPAKSAWGGMDASAFVKMDPNTKSEYLSYASSDPAMRDEAFRTLNDVAKSPTLKGSLSDVDYSAMASFTSQHSNQVHPEIRERVESAVRSEQLGKRDDLPGPVVSPGVATRIVAATGNDIVHASQIHQEIQNNPALRQEIETHIIQNNGNLDLGAIPGLPATPAPLPAGHEAPSAKISEHIAKEFKNDLNVVAQAQQAYATNQDGYRTKTNQTFIEGKAPPLPPLPPPK